MTHNTTIQDSLSPENLAAIAQSFGLSLDASDYSPKGEFLQDNEVHDMMGMVTGAHIWDALWRFGVVVDDDLNWYMPDDYDTTVSLREVA